MTQLCVSGHTDQPSCSVLMVASEALTSPVSVAAAIASGILATSALVVAVLRHRSMRRKGIPPLRRMIPPFLACVAPWLLAVLIQLSPDVTSDSAVLQVSVMLAVALCGALLLSMYSSVEGRALIKWNERRVRKKALKKHLGDDVKLLNVADAGPSASVWRSAASTRGSKHTRRSSGAATRQRAAVAAAKGRVSGIKKMERAKQHAAKLIARQKTGVAI